MTLCPFGPIIPIFNLTYIHWRRLTKNCLLKFCKFSNYKLIKLMKPCRFKRPGFLLSWICHNIKILTLILNQNFALTFIFFKLTFHNCGDGMWALLLLLVKKFVYNCLNFHYSTLEFLQWQLAVMLGNLMLLLNYCV